MDHSHTFKAGAAMADITPQKSIHLAGYPFVKRDSTGVHDNLLSSALCLNDGAASVIFIGNDVIFISKDLSLRARKRIRAATGISLENIIISATHTHSGPSTLTFVSGGHDALLPPVDADYLSLLEEGIVKSGIEAFQNLKEASLSFTVADVTGIGTNRHDPAGKSDLKVPILIAKDTHNNEVIGCMMVCCMHPTVLHEDSTLISGDFPGIARLQLQKNVFKNNCAVVYHMGTAGNQSPRYVTNANTFQEADRIAGIFSKAVEKALSQLRQINYSNIKVLQKLVVLPRKKMPDVSKAKEYELASKEKLKDLKLNGASPQALRSAEVNWFGATESLNLAEMAADGALEKIYETCMPAEIQVIAIGDIYFIAWPGEIFVEYGLKVKEQVKNAFIITLSNGDLQVYIATQQALEEGRYEANNAIFDYTSGDLLVNETIALIKNS